MQVVVRLTLDLPAGDRPDLLPSIVRLDRERSLALLPQLLDLLQGGGEQQPDSPPV